MGAHHSGQDQEQAYIDDLIEQAKHGDASLRVEQILPLIESGQWDRWLVRISAVIRDRMRTEAWTHYRTVQLPEQDTQ